MSIQAVACAIALRGVTASEKLLLIALANYADAKMRCYPSHRTLAEDTCLSQRTILSTMKSLEGRLMISRAERRREDGSRASDIITLHFAGELDSSHTATISPPPEIDDQTKPQLTALGGETVAYHEPVYNHQIEPLEADASLAEPTSSPRKAFCVRQADIDAIWEITPRLGRERSSRKELEKALRAAAGRGHAPVRVRAALVAYYASEQATKSDGEFAKGVHRVIENDRWMTWDEPAPAAAKPMTPERWRTALQIHSETSQWWDFLGPLPSAPGCQVPAHLLVEFGYPVRLEAIA